MSNRRRPRVLAKPPRPRCRRCRSTDIARKTDGRADRWITVCRRCGANQETGGAA